MGYEYSPYEGIVDERFNGKLCLGYVTNVDYKSRTCRVKTAGNPDDRDLLNVKILHLAWNGEGDFGVVLPRQNSHVVVGFINSEPIILGAYPISNTYQGGGRDNQEEMLPGDFGYAAIAGNRVLIRSGGTVEVEATKGCRTWWLPAEDTITTVCQNWELDTAGGMAYWKVDKDTGETNFQFKAYDSNEPTNAVNLEVGTTTNGPLIDLTVGAVDENLDIASPTLSVQVQADGSTSINVGPDKITISLSADGKVSMVTQGDVSINVTGKASIETSDAVNVKAGGDATVEAGGNANVKAGGNVDVKGSKIMLNGSSSGITTANSHQNVIDLITGAPVTPSTTVFGDI